MPVSSSATHYTLLAIAIISIMIHDAPLFNRLFERWMNGKTEKRINGQTDKRTYIRSNVLVCAHRVHTSHTLHTTLALKDDNIAFSILNLLMDRPRPRTTNNKVAKKKGPTPQHKVSSKLSHFRQPKS
jgi:hypothetical protein